MSTINHYQVKLLLILLGTVCVVAVACTGESYTSSPTRTAHIKTTPSKTQNYLFTGSTPTKFNEAPILADLVEVGKLPPVNQRLPKDPLIIEPPDQIGEYGGELRFSFMGAGDPIYPLETGMDSLIKLSLDGTTIEPNIAKSWKLRDNGKEWIFHLRKGMQWSDGVPFTANDYVFAWDALQTNLEFSPKGPQPVYESAGRPGQLDKIDDYTIAYTFYEPYFLFSRAIANWPGAGPYSGGTAYAPKHYLSQFHPDYASSVNLQMILSITDIENWPQLIRIKMAWWGTAGIPVTGPWVGITTANDSVWRMERNPFYYVVDPAGNQLPYLNAQVGQRVTDKEIINFHAYAGNLDFQYRHVDIRKLPLFAKFKTPGNYRLVLWPRGSGQDAAVYVDVGYVGDPEIENWLRNRDFRIALALALDREALRDSIWLGSGEIRAAIPPSGTPFYPGSNYEKKFARRDLTQANNILDRIGLSIKNSQGFRLRSDGKGQLNLILFTPHTTHINWPEMGELLIEQWNDIGLDVILKVGSLPHSPSQIQIILWEMGGTGDPWITPQFIIPSIASPFFGAVTDWYKSGGKQGVEPLGELAYIARIESLYNQGKVVPFEDRIILGQEIFRLHVDNQDIISTVNGPAFNGIAIVRSNLLNIPTRFQFIGSMRPELFFYK